MLPTISRVLPHAVTSVAGVVESAFVVAMEIASTSGECLRVKGMASSQILGRSRVMNNVCERGTETPETSDRMQGGAYRNSRCRSPTGSLKICRWLEMPHTTTNIHDQENIFDGHENASETRKVEAKLACCLLRTEGQTDQVSCEHDTRWLQDKSREE